MLVNQENVGAAYVLALYLGFVVKSQEQTAVKRRRKREGCQSNRACLQSNVNAG